MKSCTKCFREQDLSAFNKNQRTRDGLQSWCRQCYRDRQANKIRTYCVTVREKQCSTCRIVLDVSYFQRNCTTHDGLQNVCTKCKRFYEDRWYQNRSQPGSEFRHKSAERMRGVYLRRNLKRYSVSLVEYESLVGLGCGICGGPPTGRGRYAFDHDHSTGEFRGLLCSKCNTAIGQMDDDTDRLGRAIAYLEKSRRRLRSVGA